MKDEDNNVSFHEDLNQDSNPDLEGIDEDFLEWCIENSFEVSELFKLTEKRVAQYKQAHPEHIHRKITQIKAFKNVVEFNYTLRMARLVVIMFTLAFVLKKVSSYFG